MNRKILIIDLISFISGITLFALLKLCFTFIGNNLFINILFIILTTTIAIVSMILSYKSDIEHINSINLIICITFTILIYVIYNLHFWGFVDHIGINNSICLILFFMFGGKYLIYLSRIIKSKSYAKAYYIGKNSLKAKTNNYYKFISVLGMSVFVGGILLAIINMFIPVIDISMLYQLNGILQK